MSGPAASMWVIPNEACCANQQHCNAFHEYVHCAHHECQALQQACGSCKARYAVPLNSIAMRSMLLFILPTMNVRSCGTDVGLVKQGMISQLTALQCVHLAHYKCQVLQQQDGSGNVRHARWGASSPWEACSVAFTLSFLATPT